MKKILSVFAIAAFASSGAALAQKTEPVLVNPTLPPSQQAVVVASASVPGQAAVAYLEPEVVLVGNVKGPIKLGGPKYDPLGRKIYAPRAVR